MKPQVGEQVLYTIVEDLEAVQLPAEIIAVSEDAVDLKLDPNPYLDDVHWVTDVPYSAIGRPYSWHYPYKMMLDPAEKHIRIESVHYKDV